MVVEMEPAKEKEIVDGGKSDTQEKVNYSFNYL